MKRRTFLKAASLAGASASIFSQPMVLGARTNGPAGPLVLSTWDFKRPVNETGYLAMHNGGSALDAVEQSVRLVEEDPGITSVGRGGYPDRDGHLTLDASIMDENGNAGSVMCLEHIMHPISVARRVMDKTPHVVLVGEGALRFATDQGFKREELLTDQARNAWLEWRKTADYNPPTDAGNHDTIGLIAMDANGNLAGGCSTSGLAWKMRGRVGDSPIIGAGLYVDNEVGAATSTGLGETVIKIAGSFLVVELMRSGKSPQDACRLALERLIRKSPQYKNGSDFLAGFVAVNRDGEVGAMSYRKGLQYSLMINGTNSVFDAGFLVG